MTLIVPFDGSELSEIALVRAVQFDTVLEEGVIAASIIPAKNGKYARQHGWIDSTEDFDAETVVENLRGKVTDIAPDAEFHYEFADRYASVGTIGKRLRRFARDSEASITFIGSENAGRITKSFTVGSMLSGGDTYDTMIISAVRPTPVEKFEDVEPSVEVIE